MNIKFWMAGFLVIPKVYAVIASPFSRLYVKLYIFFDTAIAVTLLGEPETKDLRQ